MFISILYMFRATPCSSSGESIVSIQHLVYVTLCTWPSGMQVGKEFLPDLHVRRSPTKGDIYQMSYWYNCFSWWWARSCSKHVENWNKSIEKRIVLQVGCLQELYWYIYICSHVTARERRADSSVKMITTDRTPMDVIRYLKIRKLKTLHNKNYVHVITFNIGFFF
jgi:hypothetical protein